MQRGKDNPAGDCNRRSDQNFSGEQNGEALYFKCDMSIVIQMCFFYE